MCHVFTSSPEHIQHGKLWHRSGSRSWKLCRVQLTLGESVNGCLHPARFLGHQGVVCLFPRVSWHRLQLSLLSPWTWWYEKEYKMDGLAWRHLLICIHLFELHSMTSSAVLSVCRSKRVESFQGRFQCRAEMCKSANQHIRQDYPQTARGLPSAPRLLAALGRSKDRGVEHLTRAALPGFSSQS